MKILIIGSGGREHALAWKVAQSPKVSQVFVAPGNPGISQTPNDKLQTPSPDITPSPQHPTTSPLSANVPIASDDLDGLLSFALANAIDLTVVGPEAPLAAGIVDRFMAAGLRIFGPTQAAAALEYSKAYSKQAMRAFGVPTADFAVFSDYNAAIKFAHTLPFGAAGMVVKADGLAAGKGVLVCNDLGDVDEALTRIMVEREFGAAGDRTIIEQRISGREVSMLAFCDGTHVVMMPPARDHKRVGDGDTGPNTGGMGAYAPAPDISPEFVDHVKRTIIQPIVAGMAACGTPYVGILYAGLMLSLAPSYPLTSSAEAPTPALPRESEFAGEGVNVLEFNCRFGDPETQVILPLLESELVEIFLACIDGTLDRLDVRWRAGACATVVMAAPGYPGSYPKGLPITGLDALPAGVQAFHAGTALREGQLVTSGGRVLNVTATGTDMADALQSAYAGVECIYFEGMHFRKDIGNIAKTQI